MDSGNDEQLTALKKLKSLLNSPRLFIADYFASLRLEIDIRTETLLAVNSSSDDDLNVARQFMIDTLTLHENECLKRHQSGTNPPDFSILLKGDSPSIEIDDEVERLVLRTLLGKSFIFVGNEIGGSKVGLLLCFERWLPNESETEWIK